MSDTTQPDSVFQVRRPTAGTLPLLVSIPHTGTRVTESVCRRFASKVMAGLPMTDWHLHELYAFLPALGVTTISARYSRFVVDLNRAPDARPLYPGRFETGLVPLETFDGEPVFDRPPTAGEIEQRRVEFHAPYHQQLQTLLDEIRGRFGGVILVDAHSVASAANRLHGALEKDICLGDRDGATCSDWLRQCLCDAFIQAGFQVSVNAPYKGGYITDHYGRQEDVEAIQIEMCQRVYMDEADPAGAVGEPRFAQAATRLQAVFETLAALAARRFLNRPA